VIRKFSFYLALSMCLVIFQMMIAPELSAKELKVLSEQTATGFGHLESVAYDPKGKVLYTIVGALIIGMLNNIQTLVGVDSYYQTIIKGAVILLAVLLDARTGRK